MKRNLEHLNGKAARNLEILSELLQDGKAPEWIKETEREGIEVSILEIEQNDGERFFVLRKENRAFGLVGPRWFFIPYGFESKQRKIFPVVISEAGICGTEFAQVFHKLQKLQEETFFKLNL